MGRPRVNAALPRYASAFTDRHGKTRVRLRRTGWNTRYVDSEPGTPEFTEEYHAWLGGAKIEAGSGRAIPGTFDDLITRFYKSTIFTDLKDSTRGTYRGEIERFRAKYGDRSAGTMTAKHVSKLMENMGETPSAANNLKKRLSQLFDYAILLGMRRDNPAKPVRSFKIKSGGFKTWQEEQIAAFEARHPLGTPARLAFDLALYTAQRRSDVRGMGPQHVENGRIRVKQLKTGKTLLIPIHPKLAQSIAATKTGHLAYIVSGRGAPYTKESFGMWFAEHCKAAGLKGYSLHGLRKAASRRMAELGLSNQLIKSITGHTSDSEVARYTRDAEQERMADLAMESLANRRDPDLANRAENG
jgi:integrase